MKNLPPSPSDPPLALRTLAENLSEGIEQLAALSVSVQHALSSCDFGRASPEEFRGLQNLDLITQSLEVYAEVLREMTRLSPDDLTLQPGPLMAAMVRPVDAPDDIARGDGTVIWF